MSAGRYRTPVELEEPVRTQSADGSAVLVHVPAGTDFAEIRCLRQDEAVLSDRVDGMATHEICLRYREDIAGGWLVAAKGRRFRILSAADEDLRGRTVLCLAEEEET
ncbi:phage head closure protein [Roseibium suaedae]|uniref:Phage head-tail adaptor, putative, SPP1 family n=1 Tax=Roseibium suaedae TaxID=735517 RepID=A0A1M7CBD6_9HYPH|nr:phage head closure protein [Roseibium suaedae]SHL64510.1 phage head-tail adaptor, putative, SPP1 family [Roseibium suaedae]